MNLRVLSVLFPLLAAGVSFAQPVEAPLPPPGENPLFGMEFEFAGNGNRIVSFENMPWENYRDLMRVIVAEQGGDPSTIRKVEFTKPTSNLERYPAGERPLFRAEWIDPRGRKWMIEPEFVASNGYDGYELVTPPMDDPQELERILERIRESKLVREGPKSGVHLNLDGRKLLEDPRALRNLIMLHENNEPMLRRVFNPVRGGGHANRFARSLAVDHGDLLEEIDRIPAEELTRERMAEAFRTREAREAEVHGVDLETANASARGKLWKYRSLNLAKVLGVNPAHNGDMGVVEFRMFDLEALENPRVHRLQADLYRGMVKRALELSERGEDVRYRPRAAQPVGENPSVYNTPDDPREARAQAREMIESFGVDPQPFEPLLRDNVRKRALPTASEFRGMLDALPTGRVTHNGKAFTYGFELEGSGEGLTSVARPKDRRTNARWDSMTDAQKKAYFRRKVGDKPENVSKHFRLDTARFPWLDPKLDVELTGNWELRSKPFESLGEATAVMRELKDMTGKSGKGFHLHLRDNGADVESLRAKGSELADFIERASNWVWLERAQRMGTMTSVKSWSNARMRERDVERLANLRSTGRATIRTTIPADKSYVDVEIRGLSTWVNDIEALAKVTTEAMRTESFGPWKHTDNALAAQRLGRLARVGERVLGRVAPGVLAEHDGLLAARGLGDAPRAMSFVPHVKRYLRDVEGRAMTPELERVLDGLQNTYTRKATGEARAFSAGVGVPLLPWETEASLSEVERRHLRFARNEYLRSVLRTADRVMDGEYGLDLRVASEAGLIKHLKVTPAEARALIAFRNAGGDLTNPRAMASHMVKATGSGVRAALSPGRLRRLAHLTAVLTRAARAPGLDHDEISRQVRYKVKVWAKEANLGENLLRSLLPRPGVTRADVVDTVAERGEGFGPRRVVEGEAQPSRVSLDTVERVFEAVRQGAIARLSVRAAGTSDPVRRAPLEAALEPLDALRLEIVNTPDVLAEHAPGKVRVSTGLLNELHARAEALPAGERPTFRARVLGLILGHEAAHAGGTVAERVADVEAIRILELSRLGLLGQVGEAEVRAAVEAFERPLGAPHVDGFFDRLRNLWRYGRTSTRVRDMERAARGEPDPLARYRRADGTLEWRRLTGDRALREVGGLAHFGLALFLKEVAVVAATGDRARIEEFFEGLMTTDFYKHYGLFVAGARISEVAYTRYLQRFVKPAFVNGLLKTNLVLAAGIALPMIVDGTFEGRTFAITVASLGLSTAAVRSGVRGIKWVYDLKKARQAGSLARAGVAASRLARMGGWFYTAAELAVILLVAEKVDQQVNAMLDLREARSQLAEAGQRFVEQVNASDGEIPEALEELQAAFTDYRNFLYTPLHVDEAILAGRLEKLAREAKLADDQRRATLDRIAGRRALRANIESRHGSLEAYAESLVSEDEAEAAEQLETYMDSYNRSRAEHLREVYEDNRRDGELLADVEHLDWILDGSPGGAANDPYAERDDLFARMGRSRLTSGLEDALEDVSQNRLQTYDDERELLSALAARLRAQGRDASLLEAAAERAGRLHAADRALATGKGTSGLGDHLEEASSSE